MASWLDRFLNLWCMGGIGCFDVGVFVVIIPLMFLLVLIVAFWIGE